MADEQRDILDMKSEIEEILISLDKAAAVLGCWINEYSFSESPDPLAAIKFGEGIKTSDDVHDLQSAKWFMEYPQILQFVHITSDYLHSSRQRLTALVE